MGRYSLKLGQESGNGIGAVDTIRNQEITKY